MFTREGCPYCATAQAFLEELGRRCPGDWQYYGYLALYNVAYVLDDGLMLSLAIVTLSRLKLQERAGRWLKLVSGGVMLGLGTVLIVRPAWLVW